MLLYSQNGKFAHLVLDYCKSKWEYYFIDEFQDTGMIQYKILNKIVESSNKDKLTVIGDDDQSIYVWRGTNPNLILEDVIVDYGLDTKVIPINYRCKSEIVDFAAKSIGNNINRKEKDLKAFKDGGKVDFVRFDDNNYSWYNLTLDSFEKIKELYKTNNLSDIAVLCRNNNQLQLLNLILYMNGFQTKHTYGMKFSKCDMYSDCKSVFNILDNTNDFDWVKNNLYKFASYCNREYSNCISDLMGRHACGLREAISSIISCRSTSIKSELNLSAREKESLLERTLFFNSKFREDLDSLYSLMCSKDSIDSKANYLLNELFEKLQFKYKGDALRRFDGFLDYFIQLFKSLEYSKLKRLLKDIETLENSSDDFATDKINFSTVHGAKGLEYNNVILFGCDNVAFPNSFYIANMMNSSGYNTKDIRDYVDCERRLYYVGCTRAKNYLYISGDMRHSCYFFRESVGEEIGDTYILNDIKRRH